jgi:hypothetical protein
MTVASMADKKTILMLSDHPLATSGVGVQARWLINGLIGTGKYRFRVFGGAMRHENYDEVVVNEDFIIKPTAGFGDKNLMRKVLVQVKPDAILLFTDPRQFIWVWEMEDEIHQICPITYNPAGILSVEICVFPVCIMVSNTICPPTEIILRTSSCLTKILSVDSTKK